MSSFFQLLGSPPQRSMPPLKSVSFRCTYSPKVFIGAVPPGTHEKHLHNSLDKFGKLNITWPNKGESNYPSQGYVFAIFNDAQSVNTLLEHCEVLDGNKYMLFVQDIQRNVQIRPFALEASTLIIDPLWFRFVRLSVFIGGLPRSCTASDLALVVANRFGPILHTSIELDFQYSYPKGAARVVFRRLSDYKRAAMAGHVILELAGNSHRVEFKPFFYNGIECEQCGATPMLTEFFCITCLKYFCKNCWISVHTDKSMSGHSSIKDSKRDLPGLFRKAVCASARI